MSTCLSVRDISLGSTHATPKLLHMSLCGSVGMWCMRHTGMGDKCDDDHGHDPYILLLIQYSIVSENPILLVLMHQLSHVCISSLDRLQGPHGKWQCGVGQGGLMQMRLQLAQVGVGAETRLQISQILRKPMPSHAMKTEPRMPRLMLLCKL